MFGASVSRAMPAHGDLSGRFARPCSGQAAREPPAGCLRGSGGVSALPPAVFMGVRVHAVGRGHSCHAAHPAPAGTGGRVLQRAGRPLPQLHDHRADILDADGNVERWVAEFAKRARPYPRIWPFNPCHSASVDSPTLVERFLAATRGQVWFGEVGGVVWWRLKGKLIDHGVQYAARVAKNIFSLARLSPRITRIYYYHWRSPGSPRRARKATWDAGLVSASGAARPALWVVAKELHRHIQHSIPKVY